VKHIQTFESFLNEKKYEEGLYLPSEPAGEVLQSIMKPAELVKEEKALDSAIKTINRYNRFKKVNSILDMEIAWESNNLPTGWWDMPGDLMKKGDTNVSIEFFDSYQTGRFNAKPAILLYKDSGAKFKYYVLVVPER
jgi:hypothetical protein